MKEKISCLVVAAFLALAGTAFADSIKIGVAGAHTGDLASYGLPTVNAAKIVAKQVNDKGGIQGKQIELLVQDEECKPEKATNVATKLVSDGAKIVIGHICSGLFRSHEGGAAHLHRGQSSGDLSFSYEPRSDAKWSVSYVFPYHRL
jgi:hypothetical protein